MYALREAFPVINSIKKEITFLILVIMMFIVVANFLVIFGNAHILHTSNKPIWTYDLFAILFWIVNVGSWLATFLDIIKDNPIVHLSFFLTPLILFIWGTVVIFSVKEILSTSLWKLFLFSYVASIIVFTVFAVFIIQEVKKIKDNEAEGISTNESDGVIQGTYKLMTNSGEYFSPHHQSQSHDVQHHQPMYAPTTRHPLPPQHQNSYPVTYTRVPSSETGRCNPQQSDLQF